MNKKAVFACLLAALLTVCTITSCKPSPQISETTEFSSSEQKPNDSVISADMFADRLEAALSADTRIFIDFDIRQEHRYSDSFSMKTGFFVQLQADMENEENPRFSYVMRKNASEKDSLLLFYDAGYIYRKDDEEQYKYPISPEKAKAEIPFHLFPSLFGMDWKDIFYDAEISENEDRSITAVTELPLADYLENAKAYLKHFGGTHHEQMNSTDAGLMPIFLSVTLDENGRILSHTVEITMEAPDSKGSFYPVVYTIRTDFREIGENFSVSLPTETERASYSESEPPVTEITLGEFIRRYAISDEKSARAVYTKMTTNANAVYVINNSQFQVPLSDITQIDLSNPKKPNVSVVEAMDFLGQIQKTEIYYKDEVYYYAIGAEKFSVPYPAEEYLKNVEASAKEKAEAGISTFFLTEDMLSQAIFTVNPNQTICAAIYFDGETQRKNIFHNINAIYNDDFSAVENAVISNARVSVTLDRYNYMTSYFLDVTVSADMGSGPALMHYSIQYNFEYSEQPREIDFPDDLNFENYPLSKQDIS